MLIDEVLNKLRPSDRAARELNHKIVGWETAEIGERIPYATPNECSSFLTGRG
jgi:hypothetical protein